ncbi:MAG TPA: ABC transporter ATP-binding protein [Pseudonocardia sp.]
MACTEPSRGLAARATAPVAHVAPALWCSGIRKSYHGQVALDGVDLEVRRGEVVGLLGPNGAGKTSLIKIALGLVRPDAGQIMLLGSSGRRPRSRAAVGYLPELFRFQPWLTADEVLALHARLARISWPPPRRRESLAAVGLEARAADRVGEFSKGMQQRLGLAVALLGDPELVILDEPTSALDPLGRADVRDLLVDLRARGTAILLNSHLVGEVERICDQVVILDHGHVLAADSLATLLGARRVRLRLRRVGAAAQARMAREGPVTRAGADLLLDLGPDADTDTIIADLVADLVQLGVRVHAVEPTRTSLEDTLLTLLRGRTEQR